MTGHSPKNSDDLKLGGPRQVSGLIASLRLPDDAVRCPGCRQMVSQLLPATGKCSRCSCDPATNLQPRDGQRR